jgi:hypothetical protein
MPLQSEDDVADVIISEIMLAEVQFRSRSTTDFFKISCVLVFQSIRLLSAAAVASRAPLGDHADAVILELWPLNPFCESQSLLATVWKSVFR